MKPLINITIWQIFLIIITESASVSPENCANLISDIHKFSKSSTVSLMHFSDDENLSQMDLIFKTQILLKKYKIMTSVFNLNKVLLIKEKFFNFKKLKKDSKTMIVFLLFSEKDFKKMQKLAKFLSRNDLTNFVYFIKNDKSLFELCINPHGNPFLLNEWISLLVKCYDDISIREWNSLNKNEIKIYQRATWEPKKGLLLSSDKLLLSDEDLLNGKILLTATMREDVVPIDDYFDDLRHALELAGNFTLKNIMTEKDFGVWNESTGTWTGAVGLIQNKKVDIVTGLFTMLPERLSAVDFTEVLNELNKVLVIKRPETRVLVSWTAFFKPFTFRLWIAFALSLIVIQVIRAFMKKILPTNFHDEDLVVLDFLYICGIYCQQGLPVFPQASSLRIFYCTIFFFTFFVLSIYSAGFVSKLTIIDSNLPFESIEEFAEIKTHKLMVTSPLFNSKFKNAETSPLKEVGEMIIEMPKNIEKAIDMVCEANATIFTSDWFHSALYVKNKNICSMVNINTCFHEPVAMILRKNSPYTRAINNILKKFRANGVLKRIRKKLYKQSTLLDLDIETENSCTPITFLDISVLLIILFGSVIFAFIILFIENFYYQIHKKKTIGTLTLSQQKVQLWEHNIRISVY